MSDVGVMSWSTSSGCPGFASGRLSYCGGGQGWCARVVCSVLLCDAGLTSMYVVW